MRDAVIFVQAAHLVTFDKSVFSQRGFPQYFSASSDQLLSLNHSVCPERWVVEMEMVSEWKKLEGKPCAWFAQKQEGIPTRCLHLASGGIFRQLVTL